MGTKRTNPEPCIRDESGLITAWQVGMSEEEIEAMLKKHPGWHRSFAYLEHN